MHEVVNTNFFLVKKEGLLAESICTAGGLGTESRGSTCKTH